MLVLFKSFKMDLFPNTDFRNRRVTKDKETISVKTRYLYWLNRRFDDCSSEKIVVFDRCKTFHYTSTL